MQAAEEVLAARQYATQHHSLIGDLQYYEHESDQWYDYDFVFVHTPSSGLNVLNFTIRLPELDRRYQLVCLQEAYRLNPLNVKIHHRTLFFC